jgi:quinol monooxygenase YgiN
MEEGNFMVTVMIERRCKPGKQEELRKLSAQLRSEVMFFPGFFSGHTLVSVYNPLTFLTVHEWMNIKDWDVWKNTPERKEVIRKINELLDEPQKESVYMLTDLAVAP